MGKELFESVGLNPIKWKGEFGHYGLCSMIRVTNLPQGMWLEMVMLEKVDGVLQLQMHSNIFWCLPVADVSSTSTSSVIVCCPLE